MTFPYVIQKGDFLTAIAKKFGIADWRDIYRHPDNAAFRAKRPNPDKIFPGEVINIPVTFTAETTLLETRAPKAVIQHPEQPLFATTQSTIAQFRWSATVTMRPRGGDFEVGFIQNVLDFKAECLFKSGPQDASPRKMTFRLQKQPCLDNRKGTVTAYHKDAPIHLGELPLAGPTPPSLAASDSGIIATNDTPGGKIPLSHPKDATKKLAQITERMSLITWIAVRLSSSPQDQQSSYQFLKNVQWGLEREAIVTSLSPFTAIFKKNHMTSHASDGLGTAFGTPVLVPPLARDLSQAFFS